MPILYIDSASFDNLEVSSSFKVSSTSTINFGSNTSVFSGSFSGSFSGDGSSLNSIIVPMFKETTSSPIVTGTTANTLATQSLVPANTFAAGDVIEIRYRAVKTAGAGTVNIRSYINTSNSLSGATLISTIQGAGTILYFQSYKTLIIRSTTNSEVFLATSTVATDETSATGTSTTIVTNDWSVDQYILFAIQNGQNADSTRISYFKIFEL